jgi:hypothetical protein
LGLSDEATGGMENVMGLDYYLYVSEFGKDFNDYDGDINYQEEVVSYGIKITKTEAEAIEETLVEDVTVDMEKANDIIRRLADNLVTPCCLREVLEDICASECTI